MSHAIELSWQSVFLKAVEVVHEAVAEKKVIMMDDTPSNFITSKYKKKTIVRTSCQSYSKLLLMMFFLRKQ
jgi:hypothetical protein